MNDEFLKIIECMINEMQEPIPPEIAEVFIHRVWEIM
jgi:hypothetical protein